MKITLGRLLFALSLAVNLAFAVGYFRAATMEHRLSTPKGRAEMIIKKFDFSPEQDQTFRQLRKQARKAEKMLRHATAANKNLFWSELEKEQPDLKKISTLLRETSEKNLEFNKTVTNLMIELLAELNPAQRQKLIKIARRRSLHSGRFVMSGK